MFIEESGTDLTVTVEGEDYHAEATTDVDSDGLDDTVLVETDDGSIAFTDTDADGQADLMTQLDAAGSIVGQARFDQENGEWVQVDPVDPRLDTDEQSAGSHTGTMTVDTPDGEIELGAPTHDTDGDGTKDSIVVDGGAGGTAGDTVIYTDSDEDGDADFATEITGDGRVTVSEHAGDGDWTVIERGHLDEHGEYHRDSLDAEREAAEETGWIVQDSSNAADVHVDPRTGGWVRG